MRKLDSGLPKPSESLLMTDEYEFTSGDVNLQTGYTGEITESYYFRKLMPNRGFHVFCGLEHFLKFIENFNDKTKANEELIEWLESLGRYSDKFLDLLASHQFRGKIYSIPEGTVVFPNQHLLDVKGDSIFTQIIETELLSILNTESAVATEAAACKLIAKKRLIAEFGARRSPFPLRTSYAAYIGGVDATSYMLAGKRYGIPVVGTMPHKFVQERYDPEIGFEASETKAFTDFAIHKPDNFTALPDTYDTRSGVLNAIRVSRNTKVPLKGLRLDSGDMVSLSQKSKRLLDLDTMCRFNDTNIVSSDGLSPEKMLRYDEEGAKINGYGIGTAIVQAHMSGVYKLVMVGDQPSMKFTDNPEKRSQPLHTQIWRTFGHDSKMKYDMLTGWDEPVPEDMKEALVYSLKKEVFDGYSNTLDPTETIEDIRDYVKWQIKSLPDGIRRIGSGIPVYPIYRTKLLKDTQNGLVSKWRNEYKKDEPVHDINSVIEKALATVKDRLEFNTSKRVK